MINFSKYSLIVFNPFHSLSEAFNNPESPVIKLVRHNLGKTVSFYKIKRPKDSSAFWIIIRVSFTIQSRLNVHQGPNKTANLYSIKKPKFRN